MKFQIKSITVIALVDRFKAQTLNKQQAFSLKGGDDPIEEPFKWGVADR